MSDEKNFAAPAGEVEWMAQANPGQYGFYDFEVGPHISEEVALRRVRGTIVVAQTAFFARQLGAVALGLAPEHVKVTPCEVKKTIKKVEEAMRGGCRSFIGDTTSPGTSSGTVQGSTTRQSHKAVELHAEYPFTQERQEEVTDDKMAENPLMFRWLTVGGMNRAQCLHKYIDGYDIRLSPMFDSKVFNEFDIKGHEPWEQAVALGIERARAPISRIDVDPKRVVIIYRSRANITSDVITWEDRRGE